MTESTCRILADGTHSAEYSSARIGTLENPSEQLARQTRIAYATYGSIDMRAGEVSPANVAQLTPQERTLAEEAIARPSF